MAQPFLWNKLKVELNYSTKITCFVYNTEYSTDKSEDVILNFIYKLPEIKMLPPDITWTANRRPNGEIVKKGIYINTKFSEIIKYYGRFLCFQPFETDFLEIFSNFYKLFHRLY